MPCFLPLSHTLSSLFVAMVSVCTFLGPSLAGHSPGGLNGFAISLFPQLLMNDILDNI